jgi:hypothetical protein
MSTAYNAKYLTFELTNRCASNSMEKVAPSLADAQVDPDPDQVAAQFAFRFPAHAELASFQVDRTRHRIRLKSPSKLNVPE